MPVSTKFSHQPKTEPLSNTDKILVRQRKMEYAGLMWLWAGSITLLAVGATWLHLSTDKEEELLINILTIVCVAPLGLFFTCKLVVSLQHFLRINKTLSVSNKQIIAGTLQAITVGLHKKTITYTIGDSIISVKTSNPLRSINSCNYIAQVPVILEILPLTGEGNLLLNITYKEVPEPTVITAPADKAMNQPFMASSKSILQLLKIFLFITLAFLIVCFLLIEQVRTSPLKASFLIATPLLAIAAYFAVSFALINRRTQNAKLKVSITGFITEIFASRYDGDGAAYTCLYWYRIGSQIIPGNIDDDRFAPGDYVRFVYLDNEKGTLKALISAEKHIPKCINYN
ncbi:hypothetical protein HHL16_21810 [Pseudoflavitalea sp. G-6-1-2]|uniref:hypothetical protein n=1 Tax=Pseudoflavitalea sp. G-6-1-2 TaxID=2728841 RepID=UPI00146AF2F0|nr:hypothetical protein [Pseudoflavitalea sp. G-6-1-2]NML23530.1 hypothetical protein [Pseudoflavitalea sp. G-6-1-2]